MLPVISVMLHRRVSRECPHLEASPKIIKPKKAYPPPLLMPLIQLKEYLLQPSVSFWNAKLEDSLHLCGSHRCPYGTTLSSSLDVNPGLLRKQTKHRKMQWISDVPMVLVRFSKSHQKVSLPHVTPCWPPREFRPMLDWSLIAMLPICCKCQVGCWQRHIEGNW